MQHQMISYWAFISKSRLHGRSRVTWQSLPYGGTRLLRLSSQHWLSSLLS